MSKLVTIYGGSGFVGRYIARRMAKAGWRVRVAVRRPNEATFVRTYGAVGQVEPVLCNIRDEASVRAALQGADAVVNCVGVQGATARNTPDAVNAEGAGRVARLAAEAGIARLVHLSVLGAEKDAASEFARTKGEGDAAVLEAFPAAVILRPSVIFGIEDQFYNKIGAMIRAMPLLPVINGAVRLQPVHVDDVAAAAEALLVNPARPGGIYELGGPDVVTLREATEQALEVIGRRRVLLPLPTGLAMLPAFGLDMAQKLSLGLVKNSCITRDQLRFLAADKVVAEGARGFADLGIQAKSAVSLLPEYLWPFRPTGQYAAIKDSIRGLRP